MIPRYFSFTLLLVLLVCGAALFIEGALLHSAQGNKFWLNSDDLRKAISARQSCLDQQGRCDLLPAQKVEPEWVQLAPDLASELDEGEPIFVGLTETQGFLYLKQDKTLYKVGPIPVRSDDEQQRRNENFWFIALVSLLFLLCVLPLFTTLHRLNRAATTFSHTGRPSELTVSRHSFVQPLVSSFNRMTHSLSGLMQMQRELSATVCHEIRTPLSRLRFITEMLEESPTPTTRQRLLSITADIEKLLDEYLAFAASEQHRPEMAWQEQPLAPFLQEMCLQYQPLLSQEVRLDCPPELIALFDNTSLTRAMNNLIGNAAKYASNLIHIRAGIDGDEYCVVVEDDGPGIRSQDNLLEPFVRADSHKEGYGLGLAIVRRVMLWHGGQVSIGTSQALGGAAIELRWPMKNEANDSATPGFS
ncbi:hypothetical protein KUV89_07150 [Marinobacter hydrocarbonoclasticus]|nr:hypothetical protein [Marinobacter nauticus]